ncbi:sensor histidine kinase [Pseudonocardia acidicola]|uniref:histidine kinase n=1 Tax=Pseudonocardia acidicola TaxID=2724939 RepID=A0ABX1S334_9PSEU|nr:HAMP domain-containing sensor histidine kinase [Pseudonocardia acidicola]NMH95921.1 HAMP domain-containing histidine kinase [Pseudonocardia acidicola]
MTRPPNSESALVRRAALRLGLQAALLASMIVVLLCAVAVAVVVTSQQHAATALLHSAVASADDVIDPPAGAWLVMRNRAGTTTVSTGLPTGLPDIGALDRVAASGVPESASVRLHGVEYRMETLRQRDGTVVQGVLDLAANHTERDRLIAMLLLCGGVGLLLAAVAGTWLGYRALRPLSAALALQRRFVADAGHELLTPVTLLNTRAQLIRRRLHSLETDSKADAVLRDVDGLVADSTRLGEILEDLLLAADPTAARARLPVDLTEIIRGVLAAAGPAAAERGIGLTGPQADTPQVRVPGSPVALGRAVTALVDNAVRHAIHEVTVAVHAGNGQVAVDVLDDGSGIDAESAPRLFERFASGGAGPTDGRRHYGLGLALVSEIAAAHGGRVELLARPGPGAALRIQLPSSGAHHR